MNDIQLSLLTDMKKGGRKPILYYIGKLMATYDSDYGLSDRAALEELLQLRDDPRKLIEFTQEGKGVSWDREQTRQTEMQITQAGSDLLDSL